MIDAVKIGGRNGKNINYIRNAKQIRPKSSMITISEVGDLYFIDKPFEKKRLLRIIKDVLCKKIKMRLTAPHRGFSPHSKSGI